MILFPELFSQRHFNVLSLKNDVNGRWILTMMILGTQLICVQIDIILNSLIKIKME